MGSGRADTGSRYDQREGCEQDGREIDRGGFGPYRDVPPGMPGEHHGAGSLGIPRNPFRSRPCRSLAKTGRSRWWGPTGSARSRDAVGRLVGLRDSPGQADPGGALRSGPNPGAGRISVRGSIPLGLGALGIGGSPGGSRTPSASPGAPRKRSGAQVGGCGEGVLPPGLDRVRPNGHARGRCPPGDPPANRRPVPPPRCGRGPGAL